MGECWGVGQLTRRESLLAMLNFKPQLFISKKEKGPFTVVNLYGVWLIIIIILFRCIFPYLFIGREPSMRSANNCLEISVLLQITFCSCIIETTLLCENGRSVPRTLREWFDIFSWSNEPWSIGQLLNSKRSRSKMGPSRTIKSWLFQGLYGSSQHIHYSMKSHIFRKLGCFARLSKVIAFGQSKIPKPYWAIWLVNTDRVAVGKRVMWLWRRVRC